MFVIIVFDDEDGSNKVIGPFTKDVAEDDSDSTSFMANHQWKDSESFDVYSVLRPEGVFKQA